MKAGDVEPAHLPSNNVLRVAVSESLRQKRIDNDVFTALYKAKYMHPYNAYIHDMGLDKFFVHYWGVLQMHVYNTYCGKQFSKIAIDATGGIVRKMRRPSGNLSGAIFLYDVAVRHPESKLQYSVCNMLSERHDSDSIAMWLQRWIRDGAATPKEIVCDMSIPLLSGIAKSFGIMPTLIDYINLCYGIIFNNLNKRPPTYIRIDVAHLVKMFLNCKYLKHQRMRTRNFFVRSLAILILCSDIAHARKILVAIISVAICETDGLDCSKQPTFCDVQKRLLKNMIAFGNPSTAEQIILDTISTTENEKEKIFEENDKSKDIFWPDEFSDDSLFTIWIENIIKECKNSVIVEGDTDNMQCIPEILPYIKNLVRLFPLWTAVMNPFMTNSGTVASSSSVESNFNDIKNRIFHEKKLPLRIDDMVLHHIKNLEGTMKFKEIGLP